MRCRWKCKNGSSALNYSDLGWQSVQNADKRIHFTDNRREILIMRRFCFALIWKQALPSPDSRQRCVATRAGRNLNDCDLALRRAHRSPPKYRWERC